MRCSDSPYSPTPRERAAGEHGRLVRSGGERHDEVQPGGDPSGRAVR